MVIHECKNCGGEIEIISNGVGRCVFCRSKQSVPKIMSEHFNRANRLRLENGNFDDARIIYENIIKENPDEAEAYWGIVLCRYGIEYVKDSRSGEYLPTCNRAIETPIKTDSDFKLAVSKATDEASRNYYIEQANLIDNIMKDIMQIVNSESPYDVFISFKDKDDTTKSETKDSRKATEIYYALTSMGYKVFFSKVTLKGKAGEKYEPYIYAALKSSKVMILVGTRPEYMNARWVKNEWSRFNKMRQSGDEKLLLPVYEDMDVYDIPLELASLQALHMGDLDFLENLKKNIESFFGESVKDRETKSIEDSVKKIINGDIRSIANSKKWNERGEVFLEKKYYDDAISCFDKAIELYSENAKAYWNRFISKNHYDISSLVKQAIDLMQNEDFKLAYMYATGEEKNKYQQVLDACDENLRAQREYEDACISLINVYTTRGSDDNEISNKMKALEEKITDSKHICTECNVLSSFKAMPGVIVIGILVILMFLAMLAVGIDNPLWKIIMLGIVGCNIYFFCSCVEKKWLKIISVLVCGVFILPFLLGGMKVFPIIVLGISCILMYLFIIKVAVHTKNMNIKMTKYKEIANIASEEYKRLLDKNKDTLSHRLNELYQFYQTKSLNYQLVKTSTRLYEKQETYKKKDRFLREKYSV